MRPVILICVLIAVALDAVPARAQVGDAPRLHSIRFEGNRHLGDRQLRSAMRLRQPAWWRPFSRPRYMGSDFLASDLHAIVARYAEEGFPFARIREAVVRFNEEEDAVSEVLIRVDEGPRIHYRGRRTIGLSPEWEQLFEAGTKLKAGEPLSWSGIRAERDRLEDFCARMGHTMATTDLEIRYAADSATVLLHVDPGPPVYVGEIHVEGLTRSRERTVRRELTLGTGDLMTSRRILDSQERLLGTGVFRRSRILPDIPDRESGVADLTVRVEERKPAWYGAGAGYTSADRMRFSSEWGLRNLGGAGRRLALAGNVYYSLAPEFRGGGFKFREGLVQVDYMEPWVFGTRTRGLLSPYIRWLQEENFHQRTLGYTTALRRDLSRRTKLDLSFQSKHIYTTERGVLPEYTTRFVTADMVQDRRDNVFDPAQGRVLRITTEYAGGLLGGTNEFARVTGAWQGYLSPEPGWTFAARVKAGRVMPVGRGPAVAEHSDTLSLSRIPWEERYRIGGGNTVRGYSESRVGRLDPDDAPVGGLVMFLVSIEIRFPMFWLLQGGVFLDSGNVWSDVSEIKLRRFPDGLTTRTYNPLNVAHGVGLGVRMKTPVGPFRFDYGFKVGSGRVPGESSGTLHVALGQAF